ncbi:MAG: hypothetical protein DRP78_05430 [Candidatus Omnitrophota bacterium]|nr:MAG: hypothetical protein DRP78_05430 [Candidatus Omnitrophota bacterium]
MLKKYVKIDVKEKVGDMGILSNSKNARDALSKKDDFLFVVVIGLWLLALMYFNPRLLVLAIGPENLIAKISVVLFVICLDIF